MFTACLHTRCSDNKKNKINASKIKSGISEMLYIQCGHVLEVAPLSVSRRFT